MGKVPLTSDKQLGYQEVRWCHYQIRCTVPVPVDWNQGILRSLMSSKGFLSKHEWTDHATQFESHVIIEAEAEYFRGPFHKINCILLSHFSCKCIRMSILFPMTLNRKCLNYRWVYLLCFTLEGVQVLNSCYLALFVSFLTGLCRSRNKHRQRIC